MYNVEDQCPKRLSYTYIHTVTYIHIQYVSGTHLKNELSAVHGSLELIDGCVEGGVGASCPLQSLRDAEPLTVDSVQHASQRRRHLLRQHLKKSNEEEE